MYVIHGKRATTRKNLVRNLEDLAGLQTTQARLKTWLQPNISFFKSGTDPSGAQFLSMSSMENGLQPEKNLD